MNTLVHIKGNDVFTDSFIIAEGTKNEHRAVKQLARNYKEKFLQLGNFNISNVEINRSETRGRKEEVYQFNEPQASFLITLLKNNNEVVDFKLALVKEFYRMRMFIMEKQTAEWRHICRHTCLFCRNENRCEKERDSFPYA